MMKALWRILAELSLPPWDTRPPYTSGYMNILTWAPSREAAETKINAYLSGFQWSVISVEEAKIVEDDFRFDDADMQNLLERARLDINAILLSTLHSYKTH